MTGSPRRIDVAYVLFDYPVPSELFIQREIGAISEEGVAVRVLVVKPERAARAGHRRPPAEAKVFRCPPISSGRFWRMAGEQLGLMLASAPCRARVRQALRSRTWRETVARLRRLPVSLVLARGLGSARPDLLHAHFGSVPAIVALLVAALCDRPWGVSLHAHDIYAERIPLRDRLHTARHLVACSSTALADVVERCDRPSGDRGHLVHHGIPLRSLADRRASAVPLILAVGRFEPKKGYSVLLEACALLRREGFDFCCRLIGTGSLLRVLAEERSALLLDGSVELLPWMEPAELAQHYATASVLAVPSVIAADGDRDNIPNVLLEALACGLPVVASALPALSAVVEAQRAARLVPPGDATALARALHEVCMNAQEAARLSVAGQTVITGLFDPRVHGRRLTEIFQRSAVAEASGGGGEVQDQSPARRSSCMKKP